MTTVLNLTRLGDGGFEIVGSRPGERLGFDASDAGDINGDGIADVIISAQYGTQTDKHEGAAYVIFGKAGGRTEIDLANLSPADGFAIYGDGGEDGLRFVSGAGDVNGDGYDDVIVGAPGNDDGGRENGAAYVIYGKASGFGPLDLSRFTAADGYVIQGAEPHDQAGFVLDQAGDINGDGFADVMVRASNSASATAYVIFGTAEGRDRLDLADLTSAEGFAIRSSDRDDGAINGIASAGDINGDGLDDMIVGLPQARVGYSTQGVAYVIFGTTEPRADLDLANLSPTDGFAMVGGNNYSSSGIVAGVGDVNGDGFDDMIVSGTNTRANRTSDGIYIVYGKATMFDTVSLAKISPVDGFFIAGLGNGFGVNVSSAGDINGDGFDDMIIGAPRAESGYFGFSYIIYGQAGIRRTLDLEKLSDADGFIIKGERQDDNAGSSVSAAGDVNGDGFDDVLVGAKYNSDGGQFSGSAYIVYGQAPTGDVTRVGTAADNTIHGGAGSDKLLGAGGDDALIGGAGNDALQGQGGNDDLDGGDGDDKLIGGVGDDVMHGGDGADRLSGSAGADSLYGGAGKDLLNGGADADLFHFSLGGTAANVKDADRIADFSQAEHDRIDLSDYDANQGTPAEDAFTFIGTAAFSGTAGELRFQFAGGDTLVSGDTDGDKKADFFIRLSKNITLTADDFVFATQAGGGHLFLPDTGPHANPHLHLA